MNLKLRLKRGREKSLFFRHPWIFSGAIDFEIKKVGVADGVVPGGVSTRAVAFPADGEIVDVCDSGGNFLACGYYNSKSNIAVRVLSFEKTGGIDLDFFVKKLEAAKALREEFLNGTNTNAYRLVFAESDGLPGLIVDKYDQVLVLQIHTLGMDKLRSLAVEALVKVFKPRIIYERSDVAVRRQDGLNDMPTGVLYGEMPQNGSAGSEDGSGLPQNHSGALTQICENGVKFLVDFVRGQKTGFFLDQRENRAAIDRYVQSAGTAGGARVLNLFCYSGGFSCYALKAGASHVTSVDISKEAIDLCQKNIYLNGFVPDRHTEVCGDVFDYLEKFKAGTRAQKFDVVIVDPPAFVKSQKNLKQALKAYSRLNELALGVLREGGILVSSSCSSYVTPEMFKGALFQAALRVRTGSGGSTGSGVPADLVILEQKTQPFDHPLRLYFPEGEYLKFFVCRKG